MTTKPPRQKKFLPNQLGGMRGVAELAGLQTSASDAGEGKAAESTDQMPAAPRFRASIFFCTGRAAGRSMRSPQATRRNGSLNATVGDQLTISLEQTRLERQETDQFVMFLNGTQNPSASVPDRWVNSQAEVSGIGITGARKPAPATGRSARHATALSAGATA